MPERHTTYPEEDIENLPETEGGSVMRKTAELSPTVETAERRQLSEAYIRQLHDLAVESIKESYEDGVRRPTAETLWRELTTIVAPESHAPADADALLAEATGIFLSRIVSLLGQDVAPPGLEDVNLLDAERAMCLQWFDLNDSLLFDVPADRLMQLAVETSRHRHADFFRNVVVEQSLIVFGHASAEELARYDAYLDSLSVPQALDTLQLFGQFQNILADEDGFADIGYQPFRAAIQKIMQAHPSMIVRLRAQRLERSFQFDERLDALDTIPQPQYPRGKGKVHRIEEVFPDLFPDNNAPADVPLTETQSTFLQSLRAMSIRQRGEDIDLCARDAASIIDRDHLPSTIAWLDTAGTIQTSTYDQLVENTDMNPFAGQADSELALLLQHIHEPALRRDLETDLGIRLTDIPLRSQIQLLRFLADQDVSGYQRIQSALHHNPDVATDIANAFLAFAENPELGSTVLATAELLREHPKEAQQLFAAYAEFARNVDWEVGQILDIGNHVLRGHMPERTALLRHLLHRANHLFVSAEQELSAATQHDRPAVAVVLTAGFKREGLALRRQVVAFEDIADKLREATDQRDTEQHRARLEVAFRELVLSERPYQLPEQFFDDAEHAAVELHPETLPEARPIYFPVGISRDLPHWQEVWEGKKEAIKPVDLYAWLFWLHNQDKPVELVIADEPQAENFLRQYPDRLGTTPEEQQTAALAFARRIGDAEQATYERIIETFGLTNITVRRFAEFRDNENFTRYHDLCTRLADHPKWKEAFLAMVKKSVVKDAPFAERRQAVSYAVEELAHILSVRGTKISHEGEAPYDAIAAVLWNVEDYARQHGMQLEDLLDGKQLAPAVKAVLEALQDRCNTGKSRTKKDQPLYAYLEQFRLTLKHSPKTREVSKADGISARSVTFPFAIPETGSQSFGWRGKGSAGEEIVIGAKEPYSTYFTSRGTALFLESDQVVAAPNGEIAGKILALPLEQQAQYTERVLKPLLTQFYRVLERAPKTYGYRLGFPSKKPSEIMREFRSATSLYELIEKIQEYIIVPASREHPTAIII